MSRVLLAVALLFHPQDVQTVGVEILADGAVRLSWTLPPDPSIVGITIFRDNLDESSSTIFQIVGLATSYTDGTLDRDDDYRYWIHTRDAQNDLSDGVFVEVFTHDDDDDGEWYCYWSSAVRVPPSPAWLFLGAALLAFALRRRC
jgi:hypothetical protein